MKKISVDILEDAALGMCPSENFEEKNGQLYYDGYMIGTVVRRGWDAEARGETTEGNLIVAKNDRNTGWGFIGPVDGDQ